MSSDIITSIITTLSGFIQMKFQSETFSPFDTHPRIMFSFLSVISVYGVVEFLAHQRHSKPTGNILNNAENNVNNAILKIGLVKETRHNLGALACIFLLYILSLPFLGG
ncbi:hypothetical protein L484_023783 [Morus notabilis]|uniref:Uncharacterized protein n=1 Tax=Morus notabilis TaxID=981085 RepID=W9QQV2_9ROSA|nr:hypothetical protein L484_023783 [Morus notabilis]